MKTKLGIKNRVFLSFFIFTIIIVNVFAYSLLFFASKNIQTELEKSIINEYETIKTFIDIQKTKFFSLPKYELEKINSLGFYFYIGNNDQKLQKQYKLGFSNTKNQSIFRGDYMGYNIIIGKDRSDYYTFKQKFLEMILFLNIFLVFSSLVFSYLITKHSITPLLKLANFLKNYKKSNNKKLIQNNYGDSEIGILTKSINSFIKQNNKTLETQINFIQDVNHELKTPLMQIESNIELLENKIDEPKSKQKLEDIKQSLNNINDIISNLGFILRGEEKPRKKEKINLYRYFKEFIPKYKALADGKNIKISVKKSFDLSIDSNKYYLDRLFGNIVSNAIFYNKGDNTIKIIIEKESVKIIDKGIGIEKDELDKIFSRFYRNKNSGLYYKNGNGLGLVIVKKIIDMFGWKIEIESEINKKTEIRIKF